MGRSLVTLGVPRTTSRLDAYLSSLIQDYGGFTYGMQETTGSTVYIENTAVAEGRNELPDGDMEYADTSYWAALNGTLSKEAGTPYAGSLCLRMTYTGASPRLYDNPRITLLDGVQYRVQGAARRDGVNAGSVTFRPYSGTNVTLAASSSSTDWVEFDVAVTGAAGQWDIITNIGAGYIEIDSLSITRLNIPANDANMNATNTGATVGISAGPLGRAYYFDGVTSYVDAYSAGLNSIITPTAKFTLGIFAKVSGPGVWTGGVKVLATFESDISNLVRMQIPATGNAIRCFYIAGGTSKSIDISTSSTDYILAVMTVNLSTDELGAYLNSTAITPSISGLGTFMGNVASTKTCIGAQTTTPAACWDGYLTRFFWLYDVISQAQITRLAQLAGVV